MQDKHETNLSLTINKVAVNKLFKYKTEVKESEVAKKYKLLKCGPPLYS